MAMAVVEPNPVEASPRVLSLLDKLHALSVEQEANLDITKFGQELHDATRNAFIALDKDKSHFVYQLARTINAKNIVEAGSSFGVSTIYLALAVHENVRATGGSGIVIGTEHEPSKVEQARKYRAEVGEGVTRNIHLRQGDLRETLLLDLPVLDLVLIDIWAPMTLPALKLVQLRLKYGAAVLIDNMIGSATRYKDLLDYMKSLGSGFINLTIPYMEGLELSLYVPRKDV